MLSTSVLGLEDSTGGTLVWDETTAIVELIESELELDCEGGALVSDGVVLTPSVL